MEGDKRAGRGNERTLCGGGAEGIRRGLTTENMK